MEFRVLGTLEVLDAEERLDIPGGVPEKVLAVLIIAEGKPLKADQLVARLWPDNPPKTARDEVYNAVCKLGKITVGPNREPLVRKRKRGYYYVDTASALLDLALFNKTFSLAGEAADRGELEVAWKKQAAALSCWHGDEPLNGLDCPVLADKATELKQRRTDAREQWCGIGQQLGRHQKVLPLLRHLARENTTRESVYEKLMLALEQTGRPAEALDVYDAIRKELAGTLGTDPGPALQVLYQRILDSPEGTRKRGPTAPEGKQRPYIDRIGEIQCG